VSSLVDLLNDSTPLFPPLGQAIVIAIVFLGAWLVSRAARRIAAFFVLRSERKHAPSIEDTGVISSLRQRETAIALAGTAVRAVAWVFAALLALAVVLGADRVETIAGASFVVILVAFAAQRFLADVIAGLLMFHERWFRIGDTIAIAPWNVEGVVEDLTLRAVTVRSAAGEVMRVSNSEVKAVRVLPRGFREGEIEIFVNDPDAGRALVDQVARIVPAGPTHFIHRPVVVEVDALEDDLHRVEARASVPPGREWLATELLPQLLQERADEGLIVHGPVVMWVDEQAEHRFARASRLPAAARG
jgi:small-conductance mechanosensitive channel